MELKEQIVTRKIPWLGIVAIVYGLLVLLLVRIFAIAHHIVGSDEKVLPRVTIAMLIAILISHIPLYRMLRKPQKYKWKVITLTGVIITYVVLVKCVIGVVIKPMIYEKQLKSLIGEVTHVEVSLIGIFVTEEFEFTESTNKFVFEEIDRNQIQLIVDNIKIAPFGYPGHCACGGNQKIEFFQGDKLYAELTFHHGKNLRWLNNWPSDMSLTNNSAACLKKWLSQNGVDNFD